jgi:transcriptional regulator with XRE-family HTH domain
MPARTSPSGLRVGRLLARYRKQANLSAMRVAMRSGLSDSYVSRLEAGERQGPQEQTLDRIAGVLGLDHYQHTLLRLANGLAPLEREDVTLRQVLFLLGALPPEDLARFRRMIAAYTRRACAGPGPAAHATSGCTTERQGETAGRAASAGHVSVGEGSRLH